MATLVPIMVDQEKKGAIMVSDEWYKYANFSSERPHVIVNHSEEECVRDAFLTNTFEGFWSIFKRSIYGIYHQVSPKHLQRYCHEFALRYNTRKVLYNERFQVSVQNCAGRLTYNRLVGKEWNSTKQYNT